VTKLGGNERQKQMARIRIGVLERLESKRSETKFRSLAELFKSISSLHQRLISLVNFVSKEYYLIQPQVIQRSRTNLSSI